MGLSSLSRAPGTWPLIFPSVESDPSQDPEQPGPASTLRWLGTLPQGGGWGTGLWEASLTCSSDWGVNKTGFEKVFSYCSWGSQGKNTEVVCRSLLQWTMFCQKCEWKHLPFGKKWDLLPPTVVLSWLQGGITCGVLLIKSVDSCLPSPRFWFSWDEGSALGL